MKYRFENEISTWNLCFKMMGFGVKELNYLHPYEFGWIYRLTFEFL